jgi:hypothetical protein
LFKLNLTSLYSPNLILRDLLENILLSCSAHLFLSVLSLTFWVCCHSPFLSVLSLLLPIGLAVHFCKGPSSTSVKTLFKYIGSTSIVRGWGSRRRSHCWSWTPLHLVFLLYLYFLFSCFFDCYILARIELF